MPYIVKTNGATAGDVLESRQGVLTDIAEADRDNWRQAQEIQPALGEGVIRTTPYFEIQGDGAVQMKWNTTTVPDYWSKMTLKAYAAEKRWQRVQQGTLFNGIKLQTDDVAISKINGALKALEAGTFESVSWKTPGGWVTLDLTAMQAVHAAVSVYIQACYTAEKTISDAIEAGTVTTRPEIDNHGSWPG